MTEKTKSKYLENLEKDLVGQNPALQQAANIYHQLDQLEYDLGLLDMEDTTARKASWWPIVTVIGSEYSGKSEFINNYLKAQLIQPGLQAKLTVFQHSQNDQMVTLPGTALDGDPRFPFYQISSKLERVRKGEGSRVNTYLELKTSINTRLQDKILINTPDLGDSPDAVSLFLTRHVLKLSDLILVFVETDATKLDGVLNVVQQLLIDEDGSQKEPSGIVFVVNQEKGMTDDAYAQQILNQLKNKLDNLNLKAENLLVLDNNEQADGSVSNAGTSMLDQIAGKQNTVTTAATNNKNLVVIEEQMSSVNVHRAYAILDSLEGSIREIDDKIMPEMCKVLEVWKDRVHFTVTLILVFFATLLVFAEVNTGIVSSMLDPIIGSIALVVIIIVMLPAHFFISKTHGKYLINQLNLRKKQEDAVESLAGLFEKHMTFWLMLLPKKEPTGWNKVTKARASGLLQQANDLVRSLNDGFSSGY
jgi:hypothetical protein